MYTIIGLGNPGKEYAKTRHNVGWIVLDEMNGGLDWQMNKYAHAELALATIGDVSVVIVKPQTFMNDSGKVLSYLMKEYSITNEDVIVVHDEIDLPLGTVRISYDRGDGGHNGIKSIVGVLGSKQFVRIRIGVSILDSEGVVRKPDVLGGFSKDELETVEADVSPRVAKILTMIITEGREKAMNVFN